MSDVEPCVLALHRGSAGPALAPPPHETVFFFSCKHLHRRFFLLFSYVFHLWVVVMQRCCGGEACVFPNAEAELKKQKSAVSVFACLSTLSLAAYIFVLFALSCFCTE